MDKQIKTAIQKMNSIEQELEKFHVERTLEIRGLALALVAKTNVLLLGDPGVGKSRLVEDWRKHISGSNYFSWLLSQYTVPDEIAGAPSLKALEEDRFERKTTGMLPEAHIAFLDEVWKGNSGVLNFLLPILNERVFHNEGKTVPTPILTIVGASNELPEEDDHLDAALDRFVIKFRVNTIKEKSNWIKMMDNFLSHDPNEEITEISIEEIHALQEQVPNVEIPLGIKKLILEIKDMLEGSEIYVSPRVLNQTLRIVQAQALLSGRMVAKEDDLEIIRHTFWKEPEHEKIIYNKILSKISPDKEALEEKFTEAKDVYDQYREVKAESDSDADSEDEAIKQYMGFISSLSKIKTQLEKIKQNIKEKGKSTQLADSYFEQVTDYLSEIYNEGVGIKMETPNKTK